MLTCDAHRIALPPTIDSSDERYRGNDVYVIYSSIIYNCGVHSGFARLGHSDNGLFLSAPAHLKEHILNGIIEKVENCPALMLVTDIRVGVPTALSNGDAEVCAVANEMKNLNEQVIGTIAVETGFFQTNVIARGASELNRAYVNEI
jgi:hypothetical protein